MRGLVPPFRKFAGSVLDRHAAQDARLAMTGFCVKKKAWMAVSSTAMTT
jgi:hypothetical protein